MNEVWKDVVGWEGLYQVSSIGRVRSVDRIVRSSVGSQSLRGIVRKIQVNRYGYHVVLLSNRPRRKLASVHRLVAMAFIPNPKGMRVVRHLNGDQVDNRVENLAWGTFKQNTQDAIRHGTLVSGRRHHSTDLCEHCVKMVRSSYAAGISQSAIGNLFGISQAAVFGIVSGKSWRSVPLGDSIHPRLVINWKKSRTQKRKHPKYRGFFRLREQKGSDDDS